jgi:hypothetical protein
MKEPMNPIAVLSALEEVLEESPFTPRDTALPPDEPPPEGKASDGPKRGRGSAP